VNIFVNRFVGANALTMTDGQRLYGEIHPPLLAHETVVLDFEGVNIFATPFFNAAIGRLLFDLSADVLRDRLVIKNLSALGASTLRNVIENAKEYYGGSEARRNAVDSTVAEGPQNR
jgi:hypothetical protein